MKWSRRWLKRSWNTFGRTGAHEKKQLQWPIDLKASTVYAVSLKRARRKSLTNRQLWLNVIYNRAILVVELSNTWQLSAKGERVKWAWYGRQARNQRQKEARQIVFRLCVFRLCVWHMCTLKRHWNQITKNLVLTLILPLSSNCNSHSSTSG